MQQSFKMRYRNVISLIMATLLASGIVGSCYKSWLVKNINITFHAVNTQNVTYKLLYVEEPNADFSMGKAVVKTLPGGKHDVKMILPAQKLGRFRLEFGDRPGIVNISKFKINGNVVVSLDDFANYEFRNTDNSEILADGSITIISEQHDPYMYVNKAFNVYQGFDINWIKLGLFFGVVFVMFYGFFMIALYEKKKKKKTLYDYR